MASTINRRATSASPLHITPGAVITPAQEREALAIRLFNHIFDMPNAGILTCD